MPLLLLVAALLVALYAFMRFVSNASIETIKTVFGYIFIVFFCLILLFFAVTGRIIVSLALAVIIAPIIYTIWRKSRKKTSSPEDD